MNKQLINYDADDGVDDDDDESTDEVDSQMIIEWSHDDRRLIDWLIT